MAILQNRFVTEKPERGFCRLRNLAVIAGAFLLTISSVYANDSAAHLITGGLVLTRMDDVEMRSEDLYISTERIEVRYRFYNRSDRDITTLVAFPLPDLKAPSDYENIVIPIEAPENFLGFETMVDGAPVDMQLEQRVFALGLERTETLQSLGIPLAPHLAATREMLDRLAPHIQQQLLQWGMIEIEEYDIGQGMERHARPLWFLKTTYFWQQVFPAKTELIVEHRYTPSVGASVQTPLGTDYINEDAVENYRQHYCVEPSFERAVARIQDRGGAVFAERNVEYILTTGANWAGPIGEFRLVIDKGSTDNLVSFCGDGVEKIAATRFEIRETDFWPSQNLEILFLQRYNIENGN